jgi:hypothetical protein
MEETAARVKLGDVQLVYRRRQRRHIPFMESKNGGILLGRSAFELCCAAPSWARSCQAGPDDVG